MKRPCKNFKEFCKIIRKYSKRNNWWPWVLYEIFADEQINEVLNSKKEQGLKKFLSILKEHRGDTLVDVELELKGVLITNEDFYYIFTDSEGKYKYDLCNSPIKFKNMYPKTIHFNNSQYIVYSWEEENRLIKQIKTKSGS